MAEKAGEIYYDIEIETSQLITANQKARQELGNLGTQAKGAASGINTLETQMKSSASAVSLATKAGGSFRSQFQQAGYQIQDFIVQVQGGQSALVALPAPISVGWRVWTGRRSSGCGYCIRYSCSRHSDHCFEWW
ncbi:UNVERIFIED_ORG: hypothetical protein C7430_110192 [Pantoea agglomerans]|uniref:Phage-related minor tail protein n=1 Tax=Enterobacter agglomerans TaxID=549 RepID=A0ABD6XMB5_ENTAG|nr:hypothetical protein BEE12_12000 [Pantoea agglomerans]